MIAAKGKEREREKTRKNEQLKTPVD